MRRLIIRPGAIGDCILALPAMEFLRAGYTEIWVSSPVVPLVRFADRVRAISSTGLDLLGLPGVQPPAKLLRDLGGFDSIVSWYGTKRGELRQALPATFLDALPAAGSTEHCADFFARQVGAPVPALPRIGCPASQPGPYAVLHPFSGSPRKNWPLSQYRALAERLPWPVEWCAGPEEPLPDARRFDNLYELATWISGARVYIGNDSGISHLAAAAGAKVVAIFGPTDPAVWAPRGDRVRIVQGRLETISVEEVLHAIHSLCDVPDSGR